MPESIMEHETKTKMPWLMNTWMKTNKMKRRKSEKKSSKSAKRKYGGTRNQDEDDIVDQYLNDEMDLS